MYYKVSCIGHIHLRQHGNRFMDLFVLIFEIHVTWKTQRRENREFEREKNLSQCKRVEEGKEKRRDRCTFREYIVIMEENIYKLY